MSSKSKIVISAINVFEGGPFTILRECLQTLNQSFSDDHEIIALVHKLDLFDKEVFNHVKFLEFPKSRKSWLYRIFYEYYYFKKFAEINKVNVWLSLHDITPNLPKYVKQVVYCHNACMFYKPSLYDLLYDKTVVVFSLLYKFLYRINIKRNSLVIVQQSWMRNAFHQIYNIPLSKILVAHPYIEDFSNKAIELTNNLKRRKKKVFIYAAFPRIFKNYEVIINACNILISHGIYEFEVKLTLSGTENLYAKKIKELSSGIQQIVFLGLLSKDELDAEYINSDVLLFPSRLETWGLPISEYKPYAKTILLAELPYAHETLGNYEKCKFFDPNDFEMLAHLMEKIILHGPSSIWETAKFQSPAQPFSDSWKKMLKHILTKC